MVSRVSLKVGIPVSSEVEEQRTFVPDDDEKRNTDNDAGANFVVTKVCTQPFLSVAFHLFIQQPTMMTGAAADKTAGRVLLPSNIEPIR